jgi:hypothetical protein
MIGDTQLRYRAPKHQASGWRILGLTIPYFHSAMLSARLDGGNAMIETQEKRSTKTPADIYEN